MKGRLELGEIGPTVGRWERTEQGRPKENIHHDSREGESHGTG